MRLQRLAALLLCLSTAALAQKPSQTPRQMLDEKAPQWLKQYDVPSVSIAYIDHGKVAWTAVYGEQSPGVPATRETLYNVASLTKPVTAEIILRLAAQGRLSLDEPLAPVWLDPDLKDASPQVQAWAKLLTPRLLLSHQGGFPNWRRQTGGKLTIKFEPGTQTSYSGEGFDYLGRFAEKKTGEPFEQLARELVFEPLGLKNTAYTPQPWFAGRVAEPHGPVGETRPAVRSTWSGADLLETTAADYAQFFLTAMDDKAIGPELMRQRVTNTRNQATDAELAKLCGGIGKTAAQCRLTVGMGLGIEVFDINGETIFTHGGSDWGVRTNAYYLPATQTGMVILTNGQNGDKVFHQITALFCANAIFVATL